MSRPHQPYAGITLCAAAMLGFAIQDALIKGLSGRYAVLEVLALRSGLVLGALAAFGVYLHGAGIFKAARPGLLLLRGILAFAAFGSYYLALSRIPMADAAAAYMTAPLFVTLLSAVVLGEEVGRSRWIAVTLGFGAVLFMLQPGSALFRIEAAIPLFSALCYAMVPVLNRKIGLSEHVLTMTTYTTASFLTLCLLASFLVHMSDPAPAGDGLSSVLLRPWTWPTPRDLILVALSGAVFCAALLCITHAYRIAIVSTVAPFEYSYLIWATLLGFLAFGNSPAARTVAGGFAVVACGCYVLYRERAAQPRPASGPTGSGPRSVAKDRRPAFPKRRTRL